MPIITQKRFTALKSKLTRAMNSNDPFKLLQVANEALCIFEVEGFPDNWHLWDVAKHDAEWALRRGWATIKPPHNF